MSLVKKYISAYSSSSLSLANNLFLVEDAETAGTFYNISGDVLQGLILEGNSINTGTNTILTTGSTNIDDSNIDGSAGIDASKIADGSVSNTEFQYINGAASNFQDQIDSLSSGNSSFFISLDKTSDGDKLITISATDIQEEANIIDSGDSENLRQAIFPAIQYSVYKVTDNENWEIENNATITTDFNLQNAGSGTAYSFKEMELTVSTASQDYIIAITFKTFNAGGAPI